MGMTEFRDKETGKLYEQIGYEEYQKLPPYWEKYLNTALATVSQVSCLMGLVKAFRFSDGRGMEHVLEVGTNLGVTDLYLLKIGAQARPQFALYSIEKRKDTAVFGRAVHESATPEERSHWHFMRGKTTFDIEGILPPGTKLDMVFIDGAHAHPYPLLDLVFLMPYLHPESLVVFHDVESYMVMGELGGCYLYTRWPQEKKCLNWNVDNPRMEPTRQEHMGIVRLPGQQEELHAILLDLAAQPLDAPRFSYASGGEDWLGLDAGMLDGHLREFMRRHYARDFAEEFTDCLLASFRDYCRSWIARKHRNRIGNDFLEQMCLMPRKLRVLQQMLRCCLPGGAFGAEEGKRYAIFGSMGRYREAWNEVLRAGGKPVALVDLAAQMHGQAWGGKAIEPPGYLVEHADAYDGVVIASIDQMREVLDALLSMGIPRERICWVDLCGERKDRP